MNNSLKTPMILKFKLLFLCFSCAILSLNSQVWGGKIEEESKEVKQPDLKPKANKQDALTFIAPQYQNRSFYNIDNLPSPKNGTANGYISDPDDFISESEEHQINKILWEIEQNTTAQIAVAIVNSIGNEVPKDFAVNLFEKWGIGYADKDNGLLILTVINQRRTEFEVGYGLEPILTDLMCHRIGTDEIVPYFKKSAYGNGIIAAVKKVKKIIENPDAVKEIYSQNINYSATKNQGFTTIKGLLFYMLCFYLVLTAMIVYVDHQKIKTIDKSKEDFYDKYNDLLDLKNTKMGCLPFFVFLLFPLTALFFYQLRKQRLKKYRFSPRFSRINGKKLFLKNEWSENEFLLEANILEEKIKSVEYDVWVTEDESDVLILEYEGSSRKYSNCYECGYKTYGKSVTNIIKAATYSSSGRKEEVYLCKNCHYTTSKIKTIPKRVRQTSSSSSGSFSSSSSSYSSSSSSSSFGGGSSGGGGAGVSW